MCVCTSLSLVSVIANITNTNILVQNIDIIAGDDNVRICAHIHMCAWMNTYVRNQRLGGGEGVLVIVQHRALSATVCRKSVASTHLR